MEIKNYKLIRFLNLRPEEVEEYLLFLKYIPARKTKNDIYNMSLDDVETIKQTLNNGSDADLISVVSKVQEISGKKVLKLKILEFFGYVNSIKEQLERIIKAEQNGLTPNKVDIKWEMVGGAEKMSKFGIYNTLESLSNGDILKFKEILKLPYSEVFTILLMRKTVSELREEMDQIKTR